MGLSPPTRRALRREPGARLRDASTAPWERQRQSFSARLASNARVEPGAEPGAGLPVALPDPLLRHSRRSASRTSPSGPGSLIKPQRPAGLPLACLHGSVPRGIPMRTLRACGRWTRMRGATRGSDRDCVWNSRVGDRPLRGGTSSRRAKAGLRLAGWPGPAGTASPRAPRHLSAKGLNCCGQAVRDAARTPSRGWPR